VKAAFPGGISQQRAWIKAHSGPITSPTVARTAVAGGITPPQAGMKLNDTGNQRTGKWYREGSYTSRATGQTFNTHIYQEPVDNGIGEQGNIVLVSGPKPTHPANEISGTAAQAKAAKEVAQPQKQPEPRGANRTTLRGVTGGVAAGRPVPRQPTKAAGEAQAARNAAAVSGITPGGPTGWRGGKGGWQEIARKERGLLPSRGGVRPGVARGPFGGREPRATIDELAEQLSQLRREEAGERRWR
jgi:hypothetical protein